jgi:hypothetical protein
MGFPHRSSNDTQSPFENSPCRSANGVFLRSGAHVLDVRSAPVLENHHFRSGLTSFETASHMRQPRRAVKLRTDMQSRSGDARGVCIVSGPD